MRDVRIRYLDEKVDMASLVTQQGPAARTYWDGSEILVAGRLKVPSFIHSSSRRDNARLKACTLDAKPEVMVA